LEAAASSPGLFSAGTLIGLSPSKRGEINVNIVYHSYSHPGFFYKRVFKKYALHKGRALSPKEPSVECRLGKAWADGSASRPCRFREDETFLNTL
jgi:hypothetical protein